MTAEEKKDIIAIRNHLLEVIRENEVDLAKSNVDIERELELKSNNVKNSKISLASKMGQIGLARSIIKKLGNYLKKYSAV